MKFEKKKIPFFDLLKLFSASLYKMCHGFRLMKQDNFFWSILTTFESSIIFGGTWGSIEQG